MSIFWLRTMKRIAKWLIRLPRMKNILGSKRKGKQLAITSISLEIQKLKDPKLQMEMVGSNK
jgi:hypothetical protein